MTRSGAERTWRPMLEIDILFEDDRWRDVGLTSLAQSAFEATAAHVDLGPGFDVSVLACDDAKIAILNEDFRGKPQATNVLSWPSEDRAPLVPGERPAIPRQADPMASELGDIAIAYETCMREAETQEKRMDDHVSHLLIHGFLHLLGFDHVDDADALVMERLEAEILANLGKPDPYDKEGLT